MALVTRSRPAAHYKKRQARHHRHSKPYLKTYWPYLPMLLIVGAGLLVNSLWSHSAVLGAQSNFSSSALLSATNADRGADREAPLTMNTELAAAAQAKANDMVTRDYWSHNSPTGQTPWDFITAAGYQYESAGENLAYGFADANDTVIAWMNSPVHRANILDANYQNVGFGVASSPDYQGNGPAVVVVAEYAQPATVTAAAAATPASGGMATPAATTERLAAQPVSRIQLLTGGRAAWSALALSAIAGAAFAWFIIRHGLRLRRWALEGETFIAHHPLLDIAITFVFTAGFVLTRPGGLIR